MLHHGRERDRNDRHCCRKQKIGVEIAARKQGEYRILVLDREADPGRFTDTGKINIARDCSDQIRSHNTDQDWDDLDHALAPKIADDDHNDRHQRDEPVLRAVLDRGSGKT